MTTFTTYAYLWITQRAATFTRGAVARIVPSERGQASAEYALVLLGAAAVALIFGKWATGNDTMKRVFSTLLERIMGGMDSVRY